MANEINLGKQLEEYRISHGIDQKDVAAALSVTQQTVSNWESGKLPKSKARLDQIRRYIGGEKWPSVSPITPEERRAQYGKAMSSDREDLRDFAAFHEWVAEARREFRDALPSDLAQHTKHTINIGNARFLPEYDSDTVCAVLRFSKGDRQAPDSYGAHGGLLELAALRVLHQQIGSARLDYVLIIIGREGQLQYGFKELQAIGTILGVTIHFAPDTFAAAAICMQMEENNDF